MELAVILFRFLQHSKSFKGEYDGSKDLYSFSIFVKDFSNFENFLLGMSESFDEIIFKGNGQSKKIQLQRAIAMIFQLDEIPKPDDAADAIGLAYMWALHIKN